MERRLGRKSPPPREGFQSGHKRNTTLAITGLRDIEAPPGGVHPQPARTPTSAGKKKKWWKNTSPLNPPRLDGPHNFPILDTPKYTTVTHSDADRRDLIEGSSTPHEVPT